MSINGGFSLFIEVKLYFVYTFRNKKLRIAKFKFM